MNIISNILFCLFFCLSASAVFNNNINSTLNSENDEIDAFDPHGDDDTKYEEGENQIPLILSGSTHVSISPLNI